MPSRRSVTLLCLVALAGCQPQLPPGEPAQRNAAVNNPAQAVEPEQPITPRLADIDPILNALFSPDEYVREQAKGDLAKLRLSGDQLSVEQGLKALRAAAQPFPFDKPDKYEVSEFLVDVTARNPRPEYIPVVVELFPQFSEKAKWWALVILASLEERDAALAYMKIVRQHAREGRIPRLVGGPLVEKPRHADVFFPELLTYADVPTLAPDVYAICLAYSEAGLLTREDLKPFADKIVAAYRVLETKLQTAQQAEGVAWMWAEPYSEWRFDAGLLLDLLGHFPPESVNSDLHRGMQYRDPRLKHFAISSLLRIGETVDTKDVADVAAHAEMRNWLYQRLEKSGQTKLYPEKYLTQMAFAESEMVQWLIYPTELGRVPDEIELMKVVMVDTGLPGGVYDYYLFRFRTHEPHWAAKDGWLAGVSGPFLRSDIPTTVSLGDTFSEFKKWDGSTPESHVGDIRELVKRWREYHARGRK